jgi:hypothetical protein
VAKDGSAFASLRVYALCGMIFVMPGVCDLVERIETAILVSFFWGPEKNKHR